MQMIVSVMFLIALACCLVSTVAFRPTFFRPAHQLSLLTQVQHTRLFSTPVRPRLKRRPTWEEKYETDPLKSDSPTVDVHPPLDIFRKWFACYSSIDSPEALERRSEAWVHHMQWARRSVLGQSLRDSISADDTEVFEAIPTAKVDAAYTLLTENRMQPAGQLLILRANSTAEVQKYIQSEPLQNHGGVAPWKMFELRLAQHTIDAELEDEGESLADYFTSDVHDPLLFISMVNEPSPVGSKKAAGGAAEARKSAVQESMKYHLDAGRTVQDAPAGKTSAEAGAHFLPLYRNASRVAMLGELLSVDGDGQHSKSGKQGGGDREVLGQLLLFNAHSRADALRYLRRDPVASTGALLPLAPTGEKEEVLFDTAILAAVNVQDVSGLHHLMPRSFAEKEELDQLHYLDPEDLLLQDEQDGLMSLPALPGHFEENRRLVALLEQAGVSFAYTRMSDDDPLKHKSYVTRENTPVEPAEGVKKGRAGRPSKLSLLGDEEEGGVEGEAGEEGGADFLAEEEELEDDEEVREGSGRGRSSGAAADVADIW